MEDNTDRTIDVASEDCIEVLANALVYEQTMHMRGDDEKLVVAGDGQHRHLCRLQDSIVADEPTIHATDLVDIDGLVDSIEIDGEQYELTPV
jgi:hypothetical protein